MTTGPVDKEMELTTGIPVWTAITADSNGNHRSHSFIIIFFTAPFEQYMVYTLDDKLNVTN